MCTHIYAYIQGIRIYTYIHVYTHIYMCIYTYVYAYTRIYMYIHVCTRTCTCIHVGTGCLQVGIGLVASRWGLVAFRWDWLRLGTGCHGNPYRSSERQQSLFASKASVMCNNHEFTLQEPSCDLILNKPEDQEPESNNKVRHSLTLSLSTDRRNARSVDFIITICYDYMNDMVDDNAFCFIIRL